MIVPNNSTVDSNDIERFNALAAQWWDANGSFKPLHQFNSIRLQYLKQQICAHFDRDAEALQPLADLTILDVGCGGGLLCEPLARLGAIVTGIDAGEKNIGAAKAHLAMDNNDLDIAYHSTTIEAFNEKDFDVVLAMEIVEHVADVPLFVKECSEAVKENGLLFMATLNRTAKSLLLAKFGAEYILRLLPIGTHDWRQFQKPSELKQYFEQNNVAVASTQGFYFNPISLIRSENYQGGWTFSDDLSMNYAIKGVKTVC